MYVYLDADDGKSEEGSSVRSITDGSTTYYLDDPEGATFEGAYVEVDSTNPSEAQVGNYVVFRGLSSDNVSLRIADADDESSNKPAITAIQVVGQSRPIDRVETTDAQHGGADQIHTGAGPDLVLGGSGADTITTHGLAIYGELDSDIVAGDNAQVTLIGGEVRRIETTDFETPAGATPSGASDDDTILTGNGADLVLGGNGGDSIDTGVAGAFDYGDVRILSVNFASDERNGDISGFAGAVAASDWNNLLRNAEDRHDTDDQNGDAPYTTDLVFGGGATASGVKLTWGRELGSDDGKEADSDRHSDLDPVSQNQRLFAGYHHTSTSKTLGVDIEGLNAHFSSYDVYVYLDADDGKSSRHDSVRRITDGSTTFYLDDPEGQTFRGKFVEANSTDPLAPSRGNYVVFRNVASDVFSLRIDNEESSGDGGNRPAISGLQVVGGTDKDNVIISGDFDQDIAAGDNGQARLLGGQVYEIATTDHAQVAAGVQADDISGGELDDFLIGGNGDDAIRGEQGRDLLLGDNARLLIRDGDVLSDNERDSGGLRPYDVPGIELLSDAVGGGDTLGGRRAQRPDVRSVPG